MTITCHPKQDRGTVTVIGADIPNGAATLTRTSPGEQPYLLRGGQFDVTSGGFTKDDTEPPFGQYGLLGYGRTETARAAQAWTAAGSRVSRGTHGALAKSHPRKYSVISSASSSSVDALLPFLITS